MGVWVGGRRGEREAHGHLGPSVGDLRAMREDIRSRQRGRRLTDQRFQHRRRKKILKPYIDVLNTYMFGTVGITRALAIT